MADTDVLTLQGRLHLQHVVRQLHDGSGGVFAILFRDAADAQPVAPAILLQGIVVLLEHLDLTLQGSDGGVTVR